MTTPAKESTQFPSEIWREIELLGLSCATVAAVALAAWWLGLGHKNQHRWKSNELGDDERLDQDARAALLGYYGSLLRSWSERFVALAIVLFSIVLARPYLTFEGFRLSSSFVMALGIYAAIRTIWHGALADHVLHVSPLSQASLRAQEMGEAKSYLDRLDQEMKNGYKRQSKIGYNIMDYSGRSPYWFFLILAIVLVLYFVWPLWAPLFIRDPFIT